MREFFLPLREHLAAGLLRVDPAPPGTPGLVQAENLRPTIGGLRAAYAPVAPTLAGAAWPFPQLFFTSQGLLLATATGWFSYAGGVATPLLSGLTTGFPWALADFGAYLLAVNGSQRVVRAPAQGGGFAWAALASNAETGIPVSGALANFNGQAVAGDLPNTWQGAGTNWVAWSKIGEIDFTPGPKNTAGFRPMAWPGRVFNVKQLGQHVMVYGDQGVSYLLPVESPAPTFGLREMEVSGVAGRLAVCGNEAVHYFVDDQGELWRLSENHELTWLGFAEIIRPLLAQGLVLSFNRQAQEVIISGPSVHYTYSHRAKTLAGPAAGGVSGVAYKAGQLVIVGPAAPDLEGAKALLVTAPLDLQKRSITSLEWVEVIGAGISGLEVAVDFRYSQDGAWTRTAWRPASLEGVARAGISGTEYRVCVRCNLRSDLFLSQINLRWKGQDKRFSRGSEAINWGQGNSIGAA